MDIIVLWTGDNSGERRMQTTVARTDRVSFNDHQSPTAASESVDEDVTSSDSVELTSLTNIVRGTNVRTRRQQLACQHEV